MFYAQLYKRDVNGELSEKLGSEGVLLLDGRWSIHTARNDVMSTLNKYPQVYNTVVAFQLMKGTRFTCSSPVDEQIRLARI